MTHLHPRIEAVLASAGITYRTILHASLPQPVTGPNDVAAALAIDPARITKTLLVEAVGSDSLCLAVLPVNRKANMNLLAERLGAKRCRFASAERLQTTLDYPPMGVSPLGTSAIPVFLDTALRTFPTILVGGGKMGAEVELHPEDFARLTFAEWLTLS